VVGAKFACASGGVVTVLVAHIANRGHLHAQHEQRVVSHSKSQAAIAAWRHFGDDDMLEFFALQYLQLAESAAILFSTPLIIALISAWFLHEKLDRQRWMAIGFGFVGVLVIIRPGGHGFHPAIFLIILNAMLYAAFNLMTRRLASSDHPITTQLASAAVPSLLLAPFALWQWQMPEGWLTWGVIVLAGLTGGLGHSASALAHRYATAAVLGPFLYQQIIYMTLAGWLVFGQIPDNAVVIGACIVVMSGLFLLWREFRMQQPVE